MKTSSISDRNREIVKRLMEVRTADVIDALDRFNVYGSTIVSEEIRPLFNDIKMVGVALTLRTLRTNEPFPMMTSEEYERYATEWYSKRNNAELFLRMAEPGHILVVDADRYTQVGFWGSYIALIARDMGIAGLVIDGGCRDVREVRKERFRFLQGDWTHGGDWQAGTSS